MPPSDPTMRYLVVLGAGGGGGGSVVVVVVLVDDTLVDDSVEVVVETLVVVVDAGMVVVVVEVGGLPVYVNDAICKPAPNASDACTATVPDPGGTTTVALVAF